MLWLINNAKVMQRIFHTVDSVQSTHNGAGILSQVALAIFGRTICLQGRTKWRNCRLTPQTPDYQLGWAVLAASRLLDTLKQNF